MPTVEKIILSNFKKFRHLELEFDTGLNMLIDNELALNPTSSKAVLAQLDSMLNTIGGLTDADRVRNVVREGETERTEFKSSLSLDLRTQEKAKHIEDASFKTVAAFLNTNGGALLIGVSDSGEILGVNAEVIKFHKNNPDKFLLHWKNNLQNRIGEQYYPFISVRLADLDKKLVLLVECQPALIPCYLNGRDFYVRTNPATDKLEGAKLVEYVNNHFKPLSAP